MKKATKIISFSSSKGGVGRTMTLTNCAKIYSKGRDWAGIESSITLLVDFDFHAPGIQYYDFLSNEVSKQYQIFNSKFSSYKELQSELNQNKIGIAFLLSKIVNNNEYLKKCEQLLKIKEANSEKATADFQTYVLKDLFTQDDYNPLKHLIQLKSESLFVLPAGSPNHHEYNDTVFKFNWLEFIDKHWGVHLIDCLIYALVEHIKELPDFAVKPVRILLDQQAGISVAAAINRLLADAHVLVGGFNEQNKAGLKALVESYFKAYNDSEPWLVLNQYNLRAMPFDYTFDTPDKSPHDRFKKEDEEQRGKFISSLTHAHDSLHNRIFVTEFEKEAVQKEHFHDDATISTNELIKLIVSIEKSFIDKAPLELHEPTSSKIIFIGERIEHKNDYSGPFASMYKLLKKYFSNSEIVGLAATHEDIVALANNGELRITLSESDKKISKIIQQLTEGIYNVTVDQESDTVLRASDLDFISYPYYVYQAFLQKESILNLSEKDFVRSYPVQDSLSGTSNSYYKKNIFRWSEYCVNDSNNSVIGVPLFFNFQLLAYRRDYFSNLKNLADEFRKKYHRQFKGFNDPDDLIKFADLTFSDTGDGFKSVLLCSNPKNIAMWYEWQTIFSIFYYQNHSQIKQITSADDYKKFLLEDVAIDATLMYLNLRKETESTAATANSYDWDELIRNFYLSKNNSLIFIWTDSIPKDDRNKSNFIYQVPPSFHLFEESWLFSITKKEEVTAFTEEKISFLNKYLTPEYQKDYVKNGGLPVHKDLLTSLDIWIEYPFIPPLWSVYQKPSSKDILSKRDSFKEIFNIGNSISTILDKAKKELDFTKKEEELKNDLKKLIADNLNIQN